MRKKIAILGGGMASMTAAYELSRDDALREAYEVTVYQIGWRLGGKGATGRDAEQRILEHGLHIWFGYYDNAFRMIREVYRDWDRPDEHPLSRWTDAFKPQDFTPVGPDHFPLNWPRNDGVPGDGHVAWTPWQAFTEMLGLLAATLETWHEDSKSKGWPQPPALQVSPTVAAHLVEAGVGHRLQGRSLAHAHHALASASDWAQAIGASHQGPLQHHLPSLAELVATGAASFAGPPPPGHESGHALMRELMDIASGFVHGFVHDFLIAGKTAREVDASEFRDWLVAHGSTRAVVQDSFITRALYDTMFQYLDGDLNRPSYAAGTAAQVILRMFGTTKGAALWEMQAGMGEVVFAPLYRLLKSRGVRFVFFRDVKRLQLDPTRQRVEAVHLERQAEVLDGDYRPTFEFAGLDCWPDQPLWSQLKNGEALRQAGVNFESPWSPHQPVGTELLRQGVDFDELILGICLGAFKKLNADATLADELTAANPAFKAMTESFSLLPSMAVQLWSPRTLDELGWKLPKPAAVAGIEPLDIWADMSQTLAFERPGVDKPGTVHYLTGVMSTEAFRQPRSARDTQHKAEAELFRVSCGWITSQGPRIWPKAVTPDGGFDWNVLRASDGVSGTDRLRQQYLRANVSPAECCVVSAAGQTRYRLKAQDSGFANLKLAGTWVDTGFNTECIEAAVMSGMQAARAISGRPRHVLGEDLLQVPGHGLGLWGLPLRLLEDIVPFVERQAKKLTECLDPPRSGRGQTSRKDQA